MKQKKYTLEVTEEQLHIVADCVEDLCRFAAGQMELYNTTVMLDNHYELGERLKELKPLVTPQLEWSASYSWDGGDCPNNRQRKFIAMTYGIYREIRHALAVENQNGTWSVYSNPTLTCEDSVPLPIIKRILE